MSDDFCIIHGYDHMKSQMGNPIPFCQACEDTMKEPWEKELEKHDGPARVYMLTQEQMDRLHGAAHSGGMLGGDAAYRSCLAIGAILSEIAFAAGFDKSPGTSCEDFIITAGHGAPMPACATCGKQPNENCPNTFCAFIEPRTAAGSLD